MYEPGIKSKVLIVSLTPTIIISLLLGVFFTSSRINQLEAALKDHGIALALNIATAAEYGVAQNDKKILKRLLDSTRQDKDIKAITVYDELGNLILASGKKIELEETDLKPSIPLADSNFSGHHQIFWAPIIFREPIFEKLSDRLKDVKNLTSDTLTEDIYGWILVELARERTDYEQVEALITCGLILILGLIISFWFAKRLGYEVSDPILQLANAVNKIKQGELNVRVKTNAEGELKVLQDGFNSMAAALSRVHQEMRSNINKATSNLRKTLKTIELQNKELEIAKQAAFSANKAKSQFLANMSHEIRTPMNGIIGFTNLMLKNTNDKQQLEYLTTIKNSANNLLRIINDILDFSKIESDKMTLEQKSLSIRKLINETIELLTPQACDKNLKVTVFVYDDVPDNIISDPLRLQQIIINLLSNAIKFTKDGEVIIRTMLEQNNPTDMLLKISVEDTGIGLSEYNQQNIFNAFTQADPSIARQYGGTGLGLVIAKKLAEQMGGEIGLQSEPQIGSTFWFSFRCKIASSFEPAKENQPSIRPEEKDTNFSDTTALIVDDNKSNLKLLSCLLDNLGVKNICADNGLDAIKIAKDKRLSIIFMDIQMPEIDGFQARIEISKIDRHKKTPIVAVTAHATKEEQEYIKQQNFSDFMPKPIFEEDLEKIINKFLTKKNSSAKHKKLALELELQKMLIEELPKFKDDITKHYKDYQFEKLKNVIHKLHGACCYCDVPKLKDLIKNLEVNLKNKQDISKLIKDAIKEIDLLIEDKIDCEA